MKRILFVDDDPNIIQGLQRCLRNMRNDWDMAFSQSGHEALQILGTKSFDVIISDMRMPLMNGAELMEKVMKHYPHIIRIILSGHSDLEMILTAAKPTHIFLAKPCDADSLIMNINETLKIFELLTNERLKELVVGTASLPSIPKVYHELIAELNQSSISFNHIGELIAEDVSMMAGILKLINSAFFSLPQRVNNPQEAVNLLGLEKLKGLVIQNQIFEVFPSQPALSKFDIVQFNRDSIMTGRLAKEIALLESAENEVVTDAYMGGLFHDIGKLLLLREPELFRKIQDHSLNQSCSETEAEYHILDISHTELGASLMKLWGNSDLLTEAIAFHHHPSNSVGRQFKPLTAVHMACALMGNGDIRSNPHEPLTFDNVYLKELGLTDHIPRWIECYQNMMSC